MARIVDRDAKRLKTLGVARTRFAEVGYEAASVEGLAAAAGIGKSSPHDCSKNKEDLFYRAFEWFEQRGMRIRMERMAEGATAHLVEELSPCLVRRRCPHETEPVMRARTTLLIATVFTLILPPLARAAGPDAYAILRAAYDNWRAKSSTSDITMTVHRPDWERSMEMKAWTRGDDDALVRFVAPAKDAGNATLKMGDETWVFNPKLNQVIKLPTSMLAQSWMGSDFSYNDLSKADDILTKYTHRLLKSEKVNGHMVYTIEAIPKPDAPVVWGKQVVKVREDGVMLGETYYDQDMRIVRQMVTDKVGPIGGRDYPLVMTMRPVDEPQKWTRIETRSGQFNIALPAYLFTLSNLQNPRD